MRRFLFLASALLLAACAEPAPHVGAAPSPYPGPAPRVEAGNDSTVVIAPVTPTNRRQAFRLAELHCRQFDREAKLPRMADERTIVYECVK